MTLTLNHNPIVRIRFSGRLVEVPLHEFMLDDGASDHEIKRALAGYLGISERLLSDHVVVQDEAGNLTVRPMGWMRS